MQTQINSEWTTICKKNELSPNAGTCAQFKNQQVAIFFCKRSDNIYAVANFDPFGQANVMSRGMMGSTEGKTYVASPLYKQRFDLRTGQCFESAEHSLKTYAVRVANENVQLKEVS
ncbi:nitrite reductase small subunit NirD [Psychromonas hadalis]|uniref:nitrite reductase small subunit NirD n=1 Tax=Psychromonas hadalis TaxID=211669 RepID=UPI0003B3EFA6|nr:nitrite reductase small subunit NirD [Psychromonas hadalis]